MNGPLRAAPGPPDVGWWVPTASSDDYTAHRPWWPFGHISATTTARCGARHRTWQRVEKFAQPEVFDHCPDCARPRRVQLSRVTGYRKPPTVRACTRPGRWSNPWRVTLEPRAGAAIRYRPDPRGQPRRDDLVSEIATLEEGRARVVDLFTEALHGGGLPYGPARVRAELAGWDLACWCPLDDGPCHADVLLDVANTPTAR